MKKFSNLVKRNGSRVERPDGPVLPPSEGREPEAYIADTINAFCESGNPKKTAESVDETVFLAEIVQTAEAYPAASHRAGTTIRDVLQRKKAKPYERYNAVMLIEILAKNPGKTFLEGLAEPDVIEALKRTLQQDSDPSVQTSLRDSLGWIEGSRANDPGLRDTLKPLMGMWRDERSKRNGYYRGPPPQPGFASGPGGGYPQQPLSRSLPSPPELEERLTVFRNTAKLLRSTVDAAALDTLEANEFVNETVEQVRVAVISVENFINSKNPYPDEPTFKTLLELHLYLTQAKHHHWKKILDSRKDAGRRAAAATAQTTTTQQSDQTGQVVPTPAADFAPPPGPPPRKPVDSPPVPSTAANDPFADPSQAPAQSRKPNNYSLFGSSSNNNSRPQLATTSNGEGSRYNENWQPGQSYVARQESAANNVTMSGASPPPSGAIPASSG